MNVCAATSVSLGAGSYELILKVRGCPFEYILHHLCGPKDRHVMVRIDKYIIA